MWGDVSTQTGVVSGEDTHRPNNQWQVQQYSLTLPFM